MRQPSTCAGLQGLEEDAVAVHGFVGHHERLTIRCPGGSPALIGDLSFRSAERRYQKHAAVMDSLQPVASASDAQTPSSTIAPRTDHTRDWNVGAGRIASTAAGAACPFVSNAGA